MALAAGAQQTDADADADAVTAGRSTGLNYWEASALNFADSAW